MNGVLLIATLVSGALTLAFVLASLRKMATRSRARRVRELTVVVVCSLITGVFTLLQLISTARQLHLP